MRGSLMGSLLVLSACTAPNPAFDEPRSSDTGDSGVGPEDTGSGSGSEESGAPACELHDDRGIRLRVLEDGEAFMPRCTEQEGVLWLGNGANIFVDGRIEHVECGPGSCGCSGPTWEIDFAGSLDLPVEDLPSCGPIAVWAEELEGSCVWAGLLMQDEGEILPYYLAARTRDVPPLAFSLGLGGAGDCTPHECDVFAPGKYDLVLLGDAITVEESPVELPISFVTGGTQVPYLLDNRMSSIDEDCNEQVAWTALIQ